MLVFPEMYVKRGLWKFAFRVLHHQAILYNVQTLKNFIGHIVEEFDYTPGMGKPWSISFDKDMGFLIHVVAYIIFVFLYYVLFCIVA